jgi:5-methylcytosine-specific restriction protein A
MTGHRYKPCRECKVATINRNGYCDKHQALSVGWNRNPSAWQGKGSTRKWRTIRSAVLNRDKHLCVECKVNGICNPATEVDHIVPKNNGGTDALSNLQSLCKEHHEEKTKRESQHGGGTPK